MCSIGSRWGCAPGPAGEGHPEHGESSPVASSGSGVGVGGDTCLAACAGFASAPGAAHEMGDLALHLRAGGGVSLLPVGVGLGGLVGLEKVLAAVDGDG